MPHNVELSSTTTRFKLVSLPIKRVSAAAVSFALLVGCQTGQFVPSQGKAVSESAPSFAITKYDVSNTSDSLDWRTKMRPLFEQARVLVSEHTGVNLSDVKLNVADESSITDEVGYETERLISSQFNDKRFANRFLRSVMHSQKGTFAALYATRKAEVMISMPLMHSYQSSLPNNAEVQDSALLALLIHELIHAADDKRYKIHENRDLNFRASFTQSAAFEGHAQYETRQICEDAGCLPGLEALDRFMFGDSNPPNSLTQTVQAVSRNILEYSYVEGERFVAALAQRPNGKQLIENLLSNPPQDPIQILDPKSFPNTTREQNNQKLIEIATNFNHPWLQSPWTSVQTSPLKGVNLRTDPARRDAAVDGFTRLITSMVALQLYDQSKNNLLPIELTLMRADTDETAKLFAQNLYQNTQISGASLSTPNGFVKVRNEQNIEPEPAQLYISKEPTDGDETYYTLIGVSGLNVVQIAGAGKDDSLFISYLDQLLLGLATLKTN